MMIKKRFIFLFFAFVLVGCGEPEAETLTIVTPDNAEHVFEIELALTSAEQQKGLMFRESMEDNHGMLFVFPSAREAAFWMKNTLIPLDMLFITDGGVVHHIHHNAQPEDLRGIPSQGPSKAVLEINGGLADELGIREGSKILHEAFEK